MRRTIISLCLLAATAAAEEAAPAPAPDEQLPKFAVAGPAGFGLVTADGASLLATHWLVEADFRAFFNDPSPRPDRDTFFLRFAGMRLDAILQRSFRAQVFVNFAENRVIVLEGWLEVRIAPWLRLRAGKFLYPITEERLTPPDRPPLRVHVGCVAPLAGARHRRPGFRLARRRHVLV